MFQLDVDDSAEAKALSDGLLVIRHLLVSPAMLWAGAVADGATRSDAEEISALPPRSRRNWISRYGGAALSDGLLLIRYLFGCHTPIGVR